MYEVVASYGMEGPAHWKIYCPASLEASQPYKRKEKLQMKENKKLQTKEKLQTKKGLIFSVSNKMQKKQGYSRGEIQECDAMGQWGENAAGTQEGGGPA